MVESEPSPEQEPQRVSPLPEVDQETAGREYALVHGVPDVGTIPELMEENPNLAPPIIDLVVKHKKLGNIEAANDIARAATFVKRALETQALKDRGTPR